jgi:hypothetical protein
MHKDSADVPGQYVPPEYEAIGREFFDDLDLELEPVEKCDHEHECDCHSV